MFERKIKPHERKTIIDRLSKDVGILSLIDEVLNEQIFEHNSLKGITLDTLLRKQGILEGLEIAKGKINNLKSE